MKYSLLIILLVLFSGYSVMSQTPSDKLEVLIIDGFNNHNWEQTSSLVQMILEESGLFNVEISTTPDVPESEEWETWHPQFVDYDVIIQNTNNIKNKALRWPREVETELEDYVRDGGGLYILHSANNAFPQWEEYNMMIGLGWRKADEGVALQVSEDRDIVEIPLNEGKATYHGPRTDELIYILKSHPINKDFPKIWKTPNLELYKFARGPAENVTILSYAKDDETNINWPVDWVIAYGKGRVYNSTMGHLWKDETYPNSFRCIGFQSCLIRATEWLATGTTTYRLPNPFPSKDKIILQKELLSLE